MRQTIRLVVSTVVTMVVGAVAFLPAAKAASAAPQVRVRQGVLVGAYDAQHEAVFQGIPYAAPPVGKLRWKPPQPPAHWSGVREATTAPHSCMQMDWGWNHWDATHDSESCLYLNVATPALKPKHPLPVIFWIHGGANYNGSGHYGPQTLTRHGVVLVSINYRLGIFGFLALPALTAESPHHSSGNYGLLDQMAALRWVRANIAQFGGDPGNITIAGQSSGAIDVGMLLTSPLSRGLFQRAIDESGGPIAPDPVLPDRTQAEALGEAFAASTGVRPGPHQLAELRAIPAQKLLELANRFTAPDHEGVPTRRGPDVNVDGWVLTEQPAAALRNSSHRVPLLIGNNIQEFSFSRTSVIQPGAPPDPPNKVRAAIRKDFGQEGEAAVAAYGLAHSDSPPVDPRLGSAGTQLMTDVYFRCPARIAGQWLGRRGIPVWEYQFERPLPGTGQPSTRHSGELPYVFGWAQTPGKGIMGGTYGATDAALSQTMQGYWTNFARTGNPNGKGLPEWPRYAGTQASGHASGQARGLELMHFTAEGKAEAQPMRMRKACVLYRKHMEQGVGGKKEMKRIEGYPIVSSVTR